MGAWGHKAFENDSALDYVSDINDGVIRQGGRDSNHEHRK